MNDIIAGLDHGPDYDYPVPKYNERAFSKNDDEMIICLVLKIVTNFEKIGKLLDNRNPITVKNRYNSLLKSKKLKIAFQD